MTLTLIKGDDAILVSQRLLELTDQLTAGGDRSLMVSELTEHDYSTDGSPPDVGAIVQVVTTPPFLCDRRVVVARHMGMFSRSEQVAPLVDVLKKPVEGVDLVLVWEKGTAGKRLGAVPKNLRALIDQVAGQVVEASPKGKARRALAEELLEAGSVRLDRLAKNLLLETVRDDVGQIQGILAALQSTYGDGAAVTADQVEPFIGDRADVPPWDLTDAIDSGDIVKAIEMARRMMVGGSRHPLAVMAVLHSHYEKSLALDGAGAQSPEEAAAILGTKGSTFPAKKANELSKRLGSERLRKVINLLAQADVDLRGATAVEPAATIEVLVARLAHTSR